MPPTPNRGAAVGVLPRAALTLCGPILPVTILVWGAAQGGIAIGAWWAALAHGLLALLVARWLDLPWWWRPIAVLFAPLAVVTLAVQPPWWVWPGALGLSLLIYGSVFRTRVPLYLSGPAEWTALLGLLPAGRFRLLDVGSGLGGPLFWLARRRPDGDYTGIEIALLPWWVGWLRSRCATAPRPRMLLGNADRLDLADFDVVFAFLSPAAMPDLFARARATMRPGTLLVSCAFSVPGSAPWKTLEVPGGRPLLAWRM